MEISRRPIVIPVADSSQVGEARRAALRMAEQLDLDLDRVGAAGVIANELATNIIKHAGEGSILAQEIGANGSRGLQIIAFDKGPGIRDVPGALTDGWSSTGTLGGGLGAMQRLSDDFDLYSPSGAGAVVLCEFWREGKKPALDSPMEIGIVSTPFPGEEVNGDGWAVRRTADRVIFMVVDGLGHGIFASAAAREGKRIVLESRSDSPVEMLQECHDALAKTRGAAMAIAALDSQAGLVRFAGMGNIYGSISTLDVGRGLASHNGTLGHIMQRVQEFTYPWNADSLLILHSDGISSKWNLENYPGLRSKRPALVAAVLYRDFRRGHDDATILVASNKAA